MMDEVIKLLECIYEIHAKLMNDSPAYLSESDLDMLERLDVLIETAILENGGELPSQD